jgi:L-2-hydroxyglutarate oxidase LhgO
VLETASRRGVSIAIVGAGVVGCAIASDLARRGLDVMVLERADHVGAGITSRNSGVIHSGVFARPGTRKARSCVDGNARTYAWASKHAVPHRRTGKLVVARTSEGVARLDALEEAAASNGVEAQRIDGGEARRLEQALDGEILGALSCPSAGIVDPHALTRSLQVDAERHGASFVFRAEVEHIATAPDGWTLRTGRGPLDARFVVNAAGLFADTIAAMLGLRRPVLPCRGHYFRWRGAPSFERLIYPATPATEAGLGIHLTLELDGAVRVGPDVQWVLDKEDFSPAPQRLPAFVAAVRELVGVDLDAGALHYDGCGIRPKRHAPGEDPRDFELLAHEASIHLLGIESPGLTAALSLAREAGRFVAAQVS